MVDKLKRYEFKACECGKYPTVWCDEMDALLMVTDYQWVEGVEVRELEEKMETSIRWGLNRDSQIFKLLQELEQYTGRDASEEFNRISLEITAPKEVQG